MDFTKLVSLLDRKALFFARADLLGDPFEGSYTPANRQLRPVWEEQIGLPPGTLDDIARNANPINPYIHFISAWHESSYESAAMWSIYSRFGEGIAVRTSFKHLTESLTDQPDYDVYVGPVQYIDYDTGAIPEGNTFWPFVHKRKSFEHEREVRAVVCQFDYFHNVRARLLTEHRANSLAAKGIEDRPDIDLNDAVPFPPEGLYVPTDLGVLIERVHIAPKAAPWFADLVRSVIQRYGCSAPVSQSSLTADPVY